MKKLIILPFLANFIFASFLGFGKPTMEDANKYVKEGQYKKAAEIYLELAKDGSKEAAEKLKELYKKHAKDKDSHFWDSMKEKSEKLFDKTKDLFNF